MSDASLPVILGLEKDVELMSQNELRSLIFHIEEMSKAAGEEIEIEVKHHFSDGVYAREMHLPEGILIVGKIHKKKNMNILSSGEASVLSQDGIVRVKAPYSMIAGEGAKRVIYAHTPVVWTTIHGTHETDLDKIEEEFIAKTYEELPPVVDVKLIEETTVCHG